MFAVLFVEMNSSLKHSICSLLTFTSSTPTLVDVSKSNSGSECDQKWCYPDVLVGINFIKWDNELGLFETSIKHLKRKISDAKYMEWETADTDLQIT